MFGSASSLIDAASATATGASLLPVMVTVTVAVSVPPWLSLTVTVETRVGAVGDLVGPVDVAVVGVAGLGGNVERRLDGVRLSARQRQRADAVGLERGCGLAGDTGRRRVGEVDVGEMDGAAGGAVERRRAGGVGLLGDRPGLGLVGGSNHRLIVDPRNRDRHVLARAAALPIVQGDGENFGLALARRQRLRVCLVGGKGPQNVAGHVRGIGSGRVGDHPGGEAADRRPGLHGDGNGVPIRRIRVFERQRAPSSRQRRRMRIVGDRR